MQHRLLATCAAIAVFLGGCYYGSQKSNKPTSSLPKIHLKHDNTKSNIPNLFNIHTINSKPFSYQHGRKKLVLGKLDHFGRATGSHIQLKERQTPTAKRVARLTVNPSGWHNYKFRVANTGKTQWLFNRGHLVGYQFCGLNNEKRNLVTETTYLNQGSLNGMDSQNDKAMLFYENRLRKWLIQHPQCSLDYSVIPIFNSNELVPRSVKLTFVGYSTHGTKMRIKMPTKRITTIGKISTVYLKNTSPQATINYQTGRAKIN